MGADRSALTALGVAAALLVALVATSAGGLGSVGLARPALVHHEGSTPSPPSGDGARRSSGAPHQEAPEQARSAHGLGWSKSWARLALVIVVACLALALIATLRVSVVRRRKLPPPRSTAVPIDPEEAGPDQPESLQSVLDEQLSSLDTGTPRNAIVAAWVQLEDFASTHGIPRQPADTPAEFVVRALGAYRLDGAALERLADLYREARFSSHPMGEAEREEARSCLRDLTGAAASS